MADKLLLTDNKATNSSVGCLMTNRHPTRHETIINCCFDWFKFVFPYSTGNNVERKNNYNDVYYELKKNLPELSDEEIFKIIEIDYPYLKPGVNYYRTRDDDFKNAEDDESGVWSLQKIKTTLEHWFNLKPLIPESSNESIGSTKGFKFMTTYTPGIVFCYEGTEMNFVGLDGHERRYKTCCFELKGSGCRKVEELGVSLINTLELLYKIPGCHATRVDFATDLINDDNINFDWLKEMLFNKISFISSYKKVVLFEPLEIKSDDNGKKYFSKIGTTIKFGSEGSTSKLNIYDKKAERFENEYLDVQADSWIRFEIQVFKEKAENVIHNLLADYNLKQFNKFCKSLLFNHLDIKLDQNLYKDSNFRKVRTRTWPTHPIWDDFIGNVGRTKIKSQEKLESDFVRTRNWYDKAVIPTQTFLDIFYKENPLTKIQTLEKQIEFLENMDNKQLSILNQYRRKVLNTSDYFGYDEISKKIEELKIEKKVLEDTYMGYNSK